MKTYITFHFRGPILILILIFTQSIQAEQHASGGSSPAGSENGASSNNGQSPEKTEAEKNQEAVKKIAERLMKEGGALTPEEKELLSKMDGNELAKILQSDQFKELFKNLDSETAKSLMGQLQRTLSSPNAIASTAMASTLNSNSTSSSTSVADPNNSGNSQPTNSTNSPSYSSAAPSNPTQTSSDPTRESLVDFRPAPITSTNRPPTFSTRTPPPAQNPIYATNPASSFLSPELPSISAQTNGTNSAANNSGNPIQSISTNASTLTSASTPSGVPSVVTSTISALDTNFFGGAPAAPPTVTTTTAAQIPPSTQQANTPPPVSSPRGVSYADSDKPATPTQARSIAYYSTADAPPTQRIRPEGGQRGIGTLTAEPFEVTSTPNTATISSRSIITIGTKTSSTSAEASPPEGLKISFSTSVPAAPKETLPAETAKVVATQPLQGYSVPSVPLIPSTTTETRRDLARYALTPTTINNPTVILPGTTNIQVVAPTAGPKSPLQVLAGLAGAR